MSTLRLYEISENYQFLLDNLCDENGEVREDARAQLNEVKESMDVKCMNVVRVFKEMEVACEGIEKERKAMQAREKRIKDQVAWLKGYLLENMQACHIDKISCPQFEIKLRKNPKSVDVLNEADIPDEYWVEKRELSKEAIKIALAGGMEVPGARLIQKSSVVIR